ncbi:MAG: NUDIX hydrolase [Alicyclobacillus sp.]|nr:NUDIX hydrolase [Alicyclobacillus sp.]
MTWKDEYAFGGIVFNETGQVLLRSPRGHWGGYVWTFAKGGADPSDKTPEETALREVQEETGYECEIMASIPGEFESDTCITKYFLMRPTGRVTAFDDETQEVRWVSIEDAFEMIKLTESPKGKLRDSGALKNAVKTWESIYKHVSKDD